MRYINIEDTQQLLADKEFSYKDTNPSERVIFLT